MSHTFQESPGRWERALQRRHLNPLFGTPPPVISREQLSAARRMDQEAAIAFQRAIRDLFRRAATLNPKESSDRILELKEALEQAYEEAAGLGGDQSESQRLLRTLIEVIMRALWRNIGADPVAHHKLETEETARHLHFHLLAETLVADLIHPSSPITPEELVPTLLSTSAAALAAILTLLDPVQIGRLVTDGQRLLERLRDHGDELPEAWCRLAQIQDYLTQGESTSTGDLEGKGGN